MATFTRWLLTKRNRERNDLVGQLARDAYTDPYWPGAPGYGSASGARLKTYRAHLENCRACDKAIETLEIAYSEWLETRTANSNA